MKPSIRSLGCLFPRRWRCRDAIRTKIVNESSAQKRIRASILNKLSIILLLGLRIWALGLGICIMGLGSWNLELGTSFAQDIHFSQFNQVPLTLNPALTGITGDIQAIASNRQQWRSFTSAYSTFALSFEKRFVRKEWKNGFLGAGILILSDRAGDGKMGTLQTNISFASHILLSKYSSLTGALYSGLAQRTINYNNLQWGNQYDFNIGDYNPLLPSGEFFGAEKLLYGDIGAGILFCYEKGEMFITSNNLLKFNAGVAIFHVNQPKFSYLKTVDEKLYTKIVLHSNGFFTVPNTLVSILPEIAYFIQGPSGEIIFGSSVRYQINYESQNTGFIRGSAVSIGGFYRNKDAIILSGLFEFTNYALGISYDINVSDLSTASSGKGGMEIFLRYVRLNPFKRTLLHRSKLIF